LGQELAQSRPLALTEIKPKNMRFQPPRRDSDRRTRGGACAPRPGQGGIREGDRVETRPNSHITGIGARGVPVRDADETEC